MENMIEAIKKDFADDVKRFKITEVFIAFGEVHTTSYYDIPANILEKIEAAAMALYRKSEVIQEARALENEKAELIRTRKDGDRLNAIMDRLVELRREWHKNGYAFICE